MIVSILDRARNAEFGGFRGCQMKSGVLLLNLGGPETPADVRPFLYKLFSDPEIIRIKNPAFRHLLAWVISWTREKNRKTCTGKSEAVRRCGELRSLRRRRWKRRLPREETRRASMSGCFAASRPLTKLSIASWRTEQSRACPNEGADGKNSQEVIAKPPALPGMRKVPVFLIKPATINQ